MKSIPALILLVLPTSLTADKNGIDAYRETLDQHQLVITNKPLRQGFSAYIGASRPVFITSDSTLMAYTRLLEKVIAAQQIAQMGAHMDMVASMGKHLPPKKKDNGSTEARLLVSCAHQILLGYPPEGLEKMEKTAVETESKRLARASATHPPNWWHSKEYMPYSRMVPPSPWDQHHALTRYYQYRQWMQSLPLDPNQPHHVKACSALSWVIRDADRDAVQQAISPYYSGTQDQGILHDLLRTAENSYNAKDERKQIQKILSEKNRLLSPPTTPEKPVLDQSLTLSIRLDALTPELAKLLGSSVLPSGLSQTTAQSTFSKSLNNTTQRDHHLTFFYALTQLNATADPRAPALFHSPAWKKKQLNCTLGAWAEYRHAVAITQTTTANYLGLTEDPPGFIEPVPSFFHALGVASTQLAELSLDAHNRLEKHASILLILKLEKIATLLHSAVGKEGSIPSSLFFLNHYEGEKLNSMFPKHGSTNGALDSEWDVSDEIDRKALAKTISKKCARFWLRDKHATKFFKNAATRHTDICSKRLISLASTCFRLQALAKKQLAGKNWSGSDASYITNYGKTLAHIMFHEGNSYLSPRNDSPRITQISHLGSSTDEQVLLCGTARPRLLLIRYPAPNGKTILCQGTAYAYREQIAAKPITDTNWQKNCLKTSYPTWMKSIAPQHKPAP